MIVLDTNVLSEPLRPKPAPRVIDWLDRQHHETLATTTLTLAELRLGVDALNAAICAARGHALATRHRRDFEGLGFELLGPWSDA